MFPPVRVLIPRLPNAKGQAHQSHWGFFFCATPEAVLFAVAMRPTRRLTRKGYRMVGMAFPTRCKSVKPAAGVNLQAGGKWYRIHSMRRSEFFRVKPSLLSYPLGVGGVWVKIFNNYQSKPFLLKENGKFLNKTVNNQ